MSAGYGDAAPADEAMIDPRGGSADLWPERNRVHNDTQPAVEQAACETCGGLGKVMNRGQLWLCDDCQGGGRVIAYYEFPSWVYWADDDEDVSNVEPVLVAIPREGRVDEMQRLADELLAASRGAQ